VLSVLISHNAGLTDWLYEGKRGKASHHIISGEIVQGLVVQVNSPLVPELSSM
jgi:hypothetical protein